MTLKPQDKHLQHVQTAPTYIKLQDKTTDDSSNAIADYNYNYSQHSTPPMATQPANLNNNVYVVNRARSRSSIYST
jgi:hypothetical protein